MLWFSERDEALHTDNHHRGTAGAEKVEVKEKKKKKTDEATADR